MQSDQRIQEATYKVFAYSALEVNVLKWALDNIRNPNETVALDEMHESFREYSLDELKDVLAVLAREGLLKDLHRYGTPIERPAVEITAEGIKLLRTIGR